MWLPLIAIGLAAAYWWAERSGALARWIHRPARPRTARVKRMPLEGRRPELMDRLKVFQDFLENLPSEDDKDEPES